MTKQVSVTLLSKPGCHLCDEARAVVESVLGDFKNRGTAVSFEEINILNDSKLVRMHSEEIPVVRINGRQHSYWHVDADRLSFAIEKAAKRGLFRD